MSACLLVLWVLAAPPVEAGEGTELIEVEGRRLDRDARDEALWTEVVDVQADPRPLAGPGRALERAVGVRVVRSGDEGAPVSVQVRGAGGHQVGVLLDGVPLGSARGESVDLGWVPVGLLESVAVTRGAAGAAYGSGAMGGVVQLRTRRFEGAGGAAAVRGGSLGVAQVEGGVGVEGEAADGVVGVSLGRGTGDFAFVDAEGRAGVRRNNDHRRGAGLVRGRWRPSAGVEVGVMALGSLDERGAPGRDAFPDEQARLMRRWGLVSGWAEGAAGAVEWSGRGWARARRVVFEDPVVQSADPTRSTLDDVAVGVGGRAAYAGEGHRPWVAVEGRHERAESGVEGVGGGGLQAARLGGAVTGGWTVELGERVEVVGALRADGLEGRGLWWVPKLGAVVEVVEGAVVRINGGRLFRDPGFDELYFVGQGIRGNPGLRPEDGCGGDVGAAVERGGVRVEVVGFWQRYARLIAFVPLDAYRVTARDDFGAEVVGVEASARWSGQRAGVRWAVEAAWVGQEARFEGETEAPLPYRPRHRVTGLAELGWGWVTGFGSGRWQSGVTIDRFGARTQPGYGLVDAGLSVALPGGLVLAGEVRNVGDVRDALDIERRPLPGRTVMVELSGAWE